MKKKTVLSKTALEALYAGKKPVESPGAEPDVPDPAADVPDPAAEGADTNENSEEVSLEDKFNAITEELVELKAVNEASVKEFEKVAEETLATHVVALETAKTESEVSITALSEIVVGTLTGMRTALDLVDVNVSDMSAETLVTEFKATEEKFLSALPAGSVTPEPHTKDEDVKAINNILDVSAYEGLSI